MPIVRCDAVHYRQGFIEVLANIHDRCINIETIEINPEADISRLNPEDLDADGIVVANTELELSVEAAAKLVHELQVAIDSVMGCHTTE